MLTGSPILLPSNKANRHPIALCGVHGLPSDDESPRARDALLHVALFVQPYLVFQAPTVATTLLHVRIVLSLVEGSIVAAFLPTTWDRLAFGF
jgi:hypothetical protein